MSDKPKEQTDSREKVPKHSTNTQQISVGNYHTLSHSLGPNWQQGRRAHLSRRSPRRPGQDPLPRLLSLHAMENSLAYNAMHCNSEQLPLL